MSYFSCDAIWALSTVHRSGYHRKMDTSETSGDHTPLGDLTNATSSTSLQLIDPKEFKRGREQTPYASMSLDQRNQQNKKQCKSRQRKKGDSSHADNVREAHDKNIDDDGDAILHGADNYNVFQSLGIVLGTIYIALTLEREYDMFLVEAIIIC